MVAPETLGVAVKVVVPPTLIVAAVTLVAGALTLGEAIVAVTLTLGPSHKLVLTSAT